MTIRITAAVPAAFFLLCTTLLAQAQDAQHQSAQDNEFTDQVMSALDQAGESRSDPAAGPGAERSQALEIRFTSPVIVEQGGAVVTQADLQMYLGRMEEGHRAPFLSSRERVGRVLSNLILPRLLADYARRQGFLDNPELHAKLYQSANVLIGQEYMEQHYSERELEDYSQPAREMYLSDPGQFRSPPRYDFTHVLIKVGQERGELGAMNIVTDIYDRLGEDASLEELVGEYSDDPQADGNSGSYTGVELKELDEAVAQAIERMEPGQISEPVRSVYGWHVIRLDAVREGRQLEWEEARPEALEKARTDHIMQIRERLIQELKDSEVRIEPQNLEAFLEPYNVTWEGFSKQ